MKKILILTLFLSPLIAQSQEVGLQVYSLRNEFKSDIDKAYEHIKSWGIQNVEGAALYHDLSPEDYLKKLDQFNLKLVSMAADYNELKANPGQIVNRAKQLGVKYVVCFWIPHSSDFALNDVNDAANAFNNIGRMLAKEGISFCYHTHGYEFRPYNDGTLFDELVRQTDRASVNYEMDVFWVYHGGADPVALLEKYPGRFPLLHLKDMADGTERNLSGHADVESNVVLGEGVIDIAAIVKAARKHNVKYMFIEDESSRVVTQVPRSLKYLNTIK